MSRLLGGSASPIGWSVQYIHASLNAVLDAVREVHSDVKLRISPPRPYPEVLKDLVPFEAPWTRARDAVSQLDRVPQQLRQRW